MPGLDRHSPPVVALASSDPDVARVPAGATFTVRTARVKSVTPVTIRATTNNTSISATLTVVPS